MRFDDLRELNDVPQRASTLAHRGHPLAATEGRPTRRDDGSLILPATNFAETTPAARAWMHAAAHEYSSIASFAELSLTLMALGAPTELIARSQQAGLDEVAHFEICTAISREFGAAVVAEPPAMPDLAGRAISRDVDYEAVALAAFRDGVLGEGFAVARLREGCLHATRATRRRLEQLADDEESHVALASDVIAWCVDVVGPELAGSLRLAADLLPESIFMPADLADVPEAHAAAAGLCTAPAFDRLWRETRATAGSQLEVALAEAGIPALA